MHKIRRIMQKLIKLSFIKLACIMLIEMSLITVLLDTLIKNRKLAV
jgi:hypothetical protein